MITALAYVLKKLKVLLIEAGEVVDAGLLLIEKVKGKPTKGNKGIDASNKKAVMKSHNYLLQESPEEQQKQNTETIKMQSHLSQFEDKSMIDADGEIRLHISPKSHASSEPEDLF